MNKQEVENILISMRNPENEEVINKLLDKLIVIDNNLLKNAIKQAGGTKESVKKFFEEKITKMRNDNTQEHIPINELFAYGINGNCVHLHLPVDLHSMIEKLGFSRTRDTVNLYLLDAIDKIKEMKDKGYDKFQGKDNIYMISPILVGKSLDFLKELDFETKTYKKQELNNPEFLSNNKDARLATRIFGTDKNVATAKIDFDIISRNDWQEKKNAKVKEFKDKGIKFIDNLER